MDGILKFKNKNNLSAYEFAYQMIRRKILYCEYKPGDRLVEEELSAELNVSRTPVRQAIRLLSSDGYVLLNANRGATVKRLSEQDIHDLWLMRSRIEGLLTELAAERMPEEDIVQLAKILDQMQDAERAGNVADVMESMKTFDETINRTVEPYQLYCLIRYTQSLSWDMRLFIYDLKKESGNLYAEHYPIYLAIKQRDKYAARLIAEKHVLDNGQLFLQEYLNRTRIYG